MGDDPCYGYQVVYEQGGKYYSSGQVLGGEFDQRSGSAYARTLNLNPGEYINYIGGRRGDILDRIVIRTNQGHELEAGGEGGDDFELAIDGEVGKLSFGYGGHLHNIRVQWGPAQTMYTNGQINY